MTNVVNIVNEKLPIRIPVFDQYLQSLSRNAAPQLTVEYVGEIGLITCNAVSPV